MSSHKRLLSAKDALNYCDLDELERIKQELLKQEPCYNLDISDLIDDAIDIVSVLESIDTHEVRQRLRAGNTRIKNMIHNICYLALEDSAGV